MPIVKTIEPREHFIVQIGGDYDVCFDGVTVTIADELPAGTILADAGSLTSATSTTVLGILADNKPAGEAHVRVLTRGQPTTVDAQSISYGADADVAAVDAALAERQIVVVNK